MTHPPYSPDLAPNDFFLFPYVKNKMRGQRFSTHEETVDAFRMHVLEISQSEWQKWFDNCRFVVACLPLYPFFYTDVGIFLFIHLLVLCKETHYFCFWSFCLSFQEHHFHFLNSMLTAYDYFVNLNSVLISIMFEFTWCCIDTLHLWVECWRYIIYYDGVKYNLFLMFQL